MDARLNKIIRGIPRELFFRCAVTKGLTDYPLSIIHYLSSDSRQPYHIPVIFQVASLLAALTHPGHIVIYAPGDSLPRCRDAY
ncbi:hypothetical protein C6H66_12060 [Photorhabdus hindustanensis]|uniref:Uncharacterized protein n=1 Tax=Photorhabdus hindustanensis TaxID=2918802 RepID=A0A2S8Q158_9GAMM|nr:hypothetical protein C6H66_12060 [Photorhabdus hindustanensis]